MTNKQHARELEAQAMMYPQGEVFDSLMAGAAALDEVAALRALFKELEKAMLRTLGASA